LAGGFRSRGWWCPNGCGKSVIYLYNRHSKNVNGARFKCIRCNALFKEKMN